jgi:hypothetical protein
MTGSPAMARRQVAKIVNTQSAEDSLAGDSSPEQAEAQHQAGAVSPADHRGPDVITAVRVTGPARGLWRAGLWFGPAPTEIPLADLTEDALAAIEGDPLLAVEHITPPPA